MSLNEIMDNRLKELRIKRRIIKSSLTRMRKFVENFDITTDSISLLEFRQEELPRLNQRFDDIQTQIELITVDFFNTRSQIQNIINARKSNNAVHNSSLNMLSSYLCVQLPPISIPKFNGDIQDWEAFYDCFRSMVHEDSYFTQVQKF